MTTSKNHFFPDFLIPPPPVIIKKLFIKFMIIPTDYIMTMISEISFINS